MTRFVPAAWVLFFCLSAMNSAAGQTGELPEEITMNAPQDAEAVQIDVAVGPADAPGAKAPLTLNLAEHYGDWLLTYHTGEAVLRGRSRFHSRVAVYHRSEAGYTLKAEWFSGALASLDRPRFFTMKIGNDYVRMLWVPGVLDGTGALRADTVVHLDRGGVFHHVDFEPAPIGYARLHQAGDPAAALHEGEGIWKGEFNLIHRPTLAAGDQISYEFYIWNEGDGNANPTAGKVSGTYKLARAKDGLKIEIDTFERTDFDKP